MESLSLISRMGRRVVPVLVLALAVGWVAFAVLTWLAEGVFRDCAACPLMVEVPVGSFMMGSPDSEARRDSAEGRQHRVTIGYAFAVGVYEVTFAEWDACVRGGGCDGHEPDDGG